MIAYAIKFEDDGHKYYLRLKNVFDFGYSLRSCLHNATFFGEKHNAGTWLERAEINTKDYTIVKVRIEETKDE